jgi:hypothetical protein
MLLWLGITGMMKLKTPLVALVASSGAFRTGRRLLTFRIVSDCHFL